MGSAIEGIVIGVLLLAFLSVVVAGGCGRKELGTTIEISEPPPPAYSKGYLVWRGDPGTYNSDAVTIFVFDEGGHTYMACSAGRFDGGVALIHAAHCQCQGGD